MKRALLILLLSGSAFASPRSWLAERAVPLDDLAPLKRTFADARIVALGEATHGSREFFQLKHRLLELLVKEMGFTAFAIETSWSASLDIDEHVLTGKGDRAQLLAAQKFWTWDTEEVSALIDWMREYNKTVPDDCKVRFFGFDFQIHSDPDRSDEHRRIEAQRQAALAKPGAEGAMLRDLYMAENLARFVEAVPNRKVVVWAHNGHIATDPPHAMGAHLRKRYGNAYYALGFAFLEGSFQAREARGRQPGPLREFVVGPPPRGSIERLLADVRPGDFIVNLRAPRRPRALDENWPMRNIGAMYAPDHPEWYVHPAAVTKMFDGLAFIRTTTRARPNPTGRRD